MQEIPLSNSNIKKYLFHNDLEFCNYVIIQMHFKDCQVTQRQIYSNAIDKCMQSSHIHLSEDQCMYEL